MTGKVEERWWWGLQQKKLTGLANINYETMCIDRDIDSEFCTPMDLSQPQYDGVFRSFGGYVVDVKIGRSKIK